jgi:hypothetical protein
MVLALESLDATILQFDPIYRVEARSGRLVPGIRAG